MYIKREAFNGGERYYCVECDTTVEENFYPNTMTGTCASGIWNSDRKQAEAEGINFSGYTPCNCLKNSVK